MQNENHADIKENHGMENWVMDSQSLIHPGDTSADIVLDDGNLPSASNHSPNQPEYPPRQDDESAYYQHTRFWRDFHLLRYQRDDVIGKLKRAQIEILARLAKAASFKDDDTGSHIVRIGVLSAKLGFHLGQAPDWCAMLEKAAPMHDIGKIGIPDSILKKNGSLSPDELTIMRTHPTLGAEILGGSEVPVLELAAEVALSHHERWDGTGYPAGLARDGIPISGQIVALIDFFDALTMDRCYRKAFSYDEALLMIGEQRGKHFNPKLVDIFVQHQNEFIALREYLNESQELEQMWPDDAWMVY